jgi:hypothetical protein
VAWGVVPVTVPTTAWYFTDAAKL